MRKFNYIYSKLIKDENDFKGIVAYSIYKKEKIEYIDDFRKRKKKEPSEQELDEFHNISSSDESTKGYFSLAEKIIKNFEVKAIDNFLRETQIKQRNWIYGVGQSFAASFFYTLFIALLIVIVWTLKTNFVTVAREILNFFSKQ